MARSEKSRNLPPTVGSLLGAGVFALLLWFKDSPNATCVAGWVMVLSGGLFLLYLVYFAVAYIILAFWKTDIFLPGVAAGWVIYFGVLMVSLSFHKDLVAKIYESWDAGLFGLGVAVVALGITFSVRRWGAPSDERK